MTKMLFGAALALVLFQVAPPVLTELGLSSTTHLWGQGAI